MEFSMIYSSARGASQILQKVENLIGAVIGLRSPTRELFGRDRGPCSLGHLAVGQRRKDSEHFTSFVAKIERLRKSQQLITHFSIEHDSGHWGRPPLSISALTLLITTGGKHHIAAANHHRPSSLCSVLLRF